MAGDSSASAVQSLQLFSGVCSTECCIPVSDISHRQHLQSASCHQLFVTSYHISGIHLLAVGPSLYKLIQISGIHYWTVFEICHLMVSSVVCKPFPIYWHSLHIRGFVLLLSIYNNRIVKMATGCGWTWMDVRSGAAGTGNKRRAAAGIDCTGVSEGVAY